MNKNFIGYFLLLFQPLFMASNLIVARGGVDDVPPISLSFWRWFIFFIILFVLNYKYLFDNFQTIKKESKRSFFSRFDGMWCLWNISIYGWFIYNHC